MNINQLEVFCVVAKTGGLSQAARVLHLSQPAVSGYIQALEKSLGVVLFTRHSRGVSLTAEGRALLEHGQKMLALYESLQKTLAQVQKGELRLSLAASYVVGNYLLPCGLWSFKNKNPKVEVSLDIASPPDVIKKVFDHRVDLGFYEGPFPVGEELAARIFGTEEIIFIAPAAGKWLGKRELTMAELAREPFFLRETGSGLREALAEGLSKYGFAPKDLKVEAEFFGYDPVKAAVQSGLGIAAVPAVIAQREIKQGTLVGLRLAGKTLELNFFMVCRLERQENDLLKKLAKALCSEGNTCQDSGATNEQGLF
ncbi:MAG: LysR family transcriptional regulator [Firmicutes bacterium]|nr:LysR family transcriptional regulator [Bacillota bacterium]MCL5040287.1 LysR family transcriptional regulator [Bacillota bacterium]